MHPHSSASNHMHPHVSITCTHIGQRKHHMHPHRSAPHAPTQVSIRSTHTGQHHMHTHRSASHAPTQFSIKSHASTRQHHMHPHRSASAPHAPTQFSIMSTHICQHHLHLHMLLQSFLSSFFTAYTLSFQKLHITGLTSKVLLTRTRSTHRLILFIATDWWSYEQHNLFHLQTLPFKLVT